jgi:hypothetical protein
MRPTHPKVEERQAGIGQGPVLLCPVPKACRESRLADFRTRAPTQQNQALLCVESSLKPGNRPYGHFSSFTPNTQERTADQPREDGYPGRLSIRSSSSVFVQRARGPPPSHGKFNPFAATDPEGRNWVSYPTRPAKGQWLMAGLQLIVRQTWHPVFALLCAIAFGCVALVAGSNAADEAQRFAAAGDPVAISDRALDRLFDQGVAEREIRASLTAGDIDLAQSFLDLSSERGVQVDPALIDEGEGSADERGVGDAHRWAVCARLVDW